MVDYRPMVDNIDPLAALIAILEVLPKFLLFQSVKCVTRAIMEVLPKLLPFHNNKKHNLKT